ncbi:MAG: ABC transporter permease [Clostridiales bacterium]|nr:ABC transporter permease [Clostridiales bacterium]
MKAFTAFCKKELLESVRSFKFLILLAAFTLFGLMNAMTAKVLPDILNGSDLGGLTIQLPEPTAMDSWAQFFKNNSQLGTVVLVIVFCGMMANELNRGTLINILTKGMKRRTVILSKFTVAAALWTVAYALSLAVTYAFTFYFWGGETLPHALPAFAGPWLHGLLLLSLMILGGACFGNFFGTLLLTGGVVLVLSLLNIVPKLQKFNPMSLAADTLYLLSGQKTPADFIPALLICVAATAALLMGAIVLFDRRQV